MRIVAHPPAARCILAAERKIDTALLLCGPAFDNGPIRLAYASRLEQATELGQSLAMTAKHKTSGGIAVEPVRERRRTRQPEPQCIEMVLQALAALWALVHGQSGGFVDNQHQTVAIKEPLRYLFRSHIEMAITAPA